MTQPAAPVRSYQQQSGRCLEQPVGSRGHVATKGAGADRATVDRLDLLIDSTFRGGGADVRHCIDVLSRELRMARQLWPRQQRRAEPRWVQ